MIAYVLLTTSPQYELMKTLLEIDFLNRAINKTGMKIDKEVLERMYL